MPQTYLTRIGGLIRDARRHKGMTQSDLAELLGTSQGAVTRIEQGKQNLSLDMLAKIGDALDSEFVSLGHSGPQHLRIVGGQKLTGSIDVKTSKNAAVALLCAALLNRGRTTLRNLARIEEVNRILEVLASIGVKTRWLPDSSDLEIIPPAELNLDDIDVAAARRTRTVIMFLGPLLHEHEAFQLPYAGGCDLGTRTVEPHLAALRAFGLEVTATHGFYEARSDRSVSPRARHRAHRARRHRHRERPHGGRAPRRHHRHPQREPQLHGPGPVLLPREARRAHRRHRDDDPDGARCRRDRRRRRVLPQRGPDRGDEPHRRRRRHRQLDHDPSGADRVHRDRARDARRHGDEVRPDAGVHLGQRQDAPRRPHDDPRPAPRPDRQDPPDAVPRASTSTTCRSSRSSAPSPRAAR